MSASERTRWQLTLERRMSAVRGVVVCSIFTACAPPEPVETPSYSWDLPTGFPEPVVSSVMSDERVALGRYLFYDPRLSGNGRQRCADCHLQRFAFADPRVTSPGSTGEPGRRNSPTIANVVYASTLTWANDTLLHLEDQILLPLFGDDPVEMDLTTRETIAWEHMGYDPIYQDLFAQTWPHDPSVTRDHVVDALAAFTRSVLSGDTPYDRWLAGEAMSAEAERGAALFEDLGCAECHGGFLFSEATAPVSAFHNTGLALEYADPGLAAVTGRTEDEGRFRPPSLRNVALTAPYFHDGSAATLDDVLDHYARGGEPHPNKSKLVTGFALSAQDRADLLAFLGALSDEALLTDARWSDPWVWAP
jgi:cytochrome c peroxidase